MKEIKRTIKEYPEYPIMFKNGNLNKICFDKTILSNVDNSTLQLLYELRKTYIDWDPETDKF